MLATLIAGRLTNRVDPRLQMFLGILVICYSMWRMIDWTPDVDEWSLDHDHLRARQLARAMEMCTSS